MSSLDRKQAGKLLVGEMNAVAPLGTLLSPVDRRQQDRRLKQQNDFVSEERQVTHGLCGSGLQGCMVSQETPLPP
jgi:hypothetical protein